MTRNDAALTAADLTRFAELGGWQDCTGGSPLCDHWRDPLGNPRLEQDIPDFLAPESLHLCFEVLERFCVAHYRSWDYYVSNSYTIVEKGFAKTDVTRKSCCIRGTRAVHLSRKEMIANEPGDTINEAIIKAVLSAGESIRKGV